MTIIISILYVLWVVVKYLWQSVLPIFLIGLAIVMFMEAIRGNE